MTELKGDRTQRSVFTLTFTIEIINSTLWEDTKDVQVPLGPCLKVIKLSYQLYPGMTFDIDVMLFDVAAKINTNDGYCWVRAWQFVDSRWITFSVRHAFPVQVRLLQTHEVSVTVTDGNASEKDCPPELCFPPLEFGVRRYFGRVLETMPREETIAEFCRDLIWDLVKRFVPASIYDQACDLPTPVTDVRHQDEVLNLVQETVIRRGLDLEDSYNTRSKLLLNVTKSGTMNKDMKKKEEPKPKFEITLPGDTILAGAGRIVRFNVSGKPRDYGEIIVLLSSSNLPNTEDCPIVFINVNKLFDAPLQEFAKLGINYLYTRWELAEESHNSQLVDITSPNIREVNFNDHHAIPLEPTRVTGTTAIFLDDRYHIEVRGIRNPREDIPNAVLFGYDPNDRNFSTVTPELPKDEDDDFLIAHTKIDAQALARGMNSFINGEYPLYPPRQSVTPIIKGTCTNALNLIGVPLKPVYVVPPSMVLAAQMTLDVSLGVVGCKPPRLTACFSRLFCLVRDSNYIMGMIAQVRAINEELAMNKPEAMLTGFAVDTGDVVILYLEGPRDGNILKIWEVSEEFHPKVKPVFNTSSRFSTRLYNEFLEAISPFIVLKTYVPLCVLLACPSVYARPALPVPARIAALKFGRLLQTRYRKLPPRSEMPTVDELTSFRLELCSPPYTFPILPEIPTGKANDTQRTQKGTCDAHSGSNRINWQSKK